MLELFYFLGFFAIIVLTPVLIKLFFNRNTGKDIIAKYKDTDIGQSIFIKKYPEADVNKYTSTFIGVGLVIALGLVVTTFLYEPLQAKIYSVIDVEGIDDFEIEPPQTKREPPPPPPPPPPEIEVVEDEEIIEEEPEIEIEEIEEETVIDVPEPVEEEETNEPDFFTIVEDMPCYNTKCCSKPKSEQKKCTELELQKYIGSIKFPNIARENDIEGVVYIRFLIDKTGKVGEVQVVRGADRILNDAAKSHIKAMPKWAQPGKQRGKPVKVQYVVPIRFKLN